eukprot:3783127-Pyramimonas_sp.AAC.1
MCALVLGQCKPAAALADCEYDNNDAYENTTKLSSHLRVSGGVLSTGRHHRRASEPRSPSGGSRRRRDIEN